MKTFTVQHGGRTSTVKFSDESWREAVHDGQGWIAADGSLVLKSDRLPPLRKALVAAGWMETT